MSRRDKLLKKAHESPRNMRFEELCSLAESYGWEFRRQKGSHKLYANPSLSSEQGRRMSFQPDNNGMAKDYQIVQLLDAIENLK